VDQTAERVAHNQAAFRDANERIEDAADAMLDLHEIPLLCECPQRECTEIGRLTRKEYERVRSEGAWFWVVPGHETTTVDGVEVARVLERHERFTVLEKVGEAGAVAEALDPRRPVEGTHG
jgi:hypothetical protein